MTLKTLSCGIGVYLVPGLKLAGAGVPVYVAVTDTLALPPGIVYCGFQSA